MRPPRLLALVALLAALLSAGCSCRRCERERERVLLERGEPIERDIHRDGSFLTETWYYWAEGETVVFFWDERECGCEMSRYKLAPRTKEAAGAAPVEVERSFSTTSSNPYRP